MAVVQETPFVERGRYKKERVNWAGRGLEGGTGACRDEGIFHVLVMLQ